jgi:uncharacterized DUF497 family protein
MYYSSSRPSPSNPDRKFEFDERKSLNNKKKHGIDFEEAKRLWLDQRLVEMPARSEDEARSLVVGTIGEDHWAAIVAYRGEMTRIISVRRARAKEIEIYEG